MLPNQYNSLVLEAGCDEAGRGPLAGPVFAAAVILPKDFQNSLLNDSKKLSEKNRIILREIIEKEAIAFCVSSVSAEEIDKINILRASILAMHKAIEGLCLKPEALVIDGNKFYDYPGIPHTCIVKGDSKYANIAAASILAKTYRDDYMKEEALKFPQYGWEQNMGYPTKKHKEAIRKYGPSPLHRLSFKGTSKNSLMQINF